MALAGLYQDEGWLLCNGKEILARAAADIAGIRFSDHPTRARVIVHGVGPPGLGAAPADCRSQGAICQRLRLGLDRFRHLPEVR
jgi:hypothetical protein